MANIVNGRYGLIEPGDGITVLCMSGGEINLFGNYTKIKTKICDSFSVIKDVLSEKMVEDTPTQMQVAGYTVSGILAGVAVIATVATGGLFLGVILGGAAITTSVYTTKTVESDRETGYERSWKEFWGGYAKSAVAGAVAGAVTGAAVYGIVAAPTAAIASISGAVGTSGVTGTLTAAGSGGAMFSGTVVTEATTIGEQASIAMEISSFTSNIIPAILTLGSNYDLFQGMNRLADQIAGNYISNYSEKEQSKESDDTDEDAQAEESKEYDGVEEQEKEEGEDDPDSILEGVKIEDGSTPKNKIPNNDSTTKHIFRDAEGHVEDTPNNRNLLENTSNKAENFRGTDKYGNEWYTETLEDGKEVWVETRNGNIFDGGVNDTPRPWSPDTGLKKP